MTKIEVKKSVLSEATIVNKQISEFDMAYDEKYFKERIGNKKNLVLVAYMGKISVGYMVSYNKFNDGSFYCWMAGVVPKFRKKGALTELMNYLEKWAKAQGYEKIKIKTRNNRREMLSFLIKNGFMFTRVEKREELKDNRIELEKQLFST